MTFDSLTESVITFVREHQAWTPLIVAALAFCESVAFLSLLVPATVILVGIGGLIGAAHLSFWPICLAAGFGAALGDWLSYEVGYFFKDSSRRIWPLNKYPEMIVKAEAFTQRFGPWAIFLGRFFGPARAVVPLVAGIFEMPRLTFQLANITSAILWAFVLLAPGAGLLSYLKG